MKDILLFTNNMITAINAINYGIKTHCIGESSVNNSAVLSGPTSYRKVRKYTRTYFSFLLTGWVQAA